MGSTPLSFQEPPSALILGGSNGAGKSTAAEGLLPEIAGLETFVNADTVARGLNGFAPQASALAAGRLMLIRLKELARQHAGFAFETTLSLLLDARPRIWPSRSLPWRRRMRARDAGQR